MLRAGLGEDVEFNRTIGAEEQNAGIGFPFDESLCDSDPREEMSPRASSGEDVQWCGHSIGYFELTSHWIESVVNSAGWRKGKL